MEDIILKTSIGTFIGKQHEDTYEFLGIPYAKAGRFEYSTLINSYIDITDATKMGKACPQYRQYYPNLDSPERLFYYKEFRQGIEFTYDSNAPAGSRVKKILIGGQNIEENKIYTIAMSDFQKAGGDGYGMLKNLKVIGQFGFTEDCLVDYINKIGIKGIETGRITRL